MTDTAHETLPSGEQVALCDPGELADWRASMGGVQQLLYHVDCEGGLGGWSSVLATTFRIESFQQNRT